MSRRAVLTDAQWERICELLPSSEGRVGRPFRDHRQVVEGIVYRYRTGIAWRDLPQEFGPWQTVWKRHRRFSLDGTWDKLLTRLLADATLQVRSTGRCRSTPRSTARTSTRRPPRHTGGTAELHESARRAG